MFGQMTRGRSPGDATKLLALLTDLSQGDSEQAYIAKRMALGVERHTLPDDLVVTLTAMHPGAVTNLIDRLASRRATIYDLPRQLVLALAAKWAGGPRRTRSLHLS